MQNISVSLIQSPLAWEDPRKNLELFSRKIRAIDQPTDLIVLPEMFTTGFSMEARKLAEPMGGASMEWMKDMAGEKNSVVCGSLIVEEGGKFYNRMIWMPPNGQFSAYDKYHLFSHAGENLHYQTGTKKQVVRLRGWKILLLICYDLRFPVFIKNKVDKDGNFDYDCILNVANWPASRSHAWRILLMARAIENQAYVIGLNRVGSDGRGISYCGDSAVISPRGENLSNIMPGAGQTETLVMPRCQLESFRSEFRPWADWDAFSMNP